jgi:hypothetical protein
MNLPNHHFSDGTKKKGQVPYNKIYNRSTHSKEVDEQSNRP